jgi:hypothetical protein
MKGSLVANDFRELHKNLKLKIIKYELIIVYPKWPAIQIWLLEILGIKWRNLFEAMFKIGNLLRRLIHSHPVMSNWLLTHGLL